MRCPKCGYISFDHLATCLNCSKDFSDLLSAAHGTTYSMSAPLFLKFSRNAESAENDVDSQPIQDELEGELDLVDPDLNILIKEEDEGIEFHPGDMPLKNEFGGLDDDIAISLNEEEFDAGAGDSEMEVDLSQFEEISLEDGDSGPGEEKFSMDLPDELADISDLAPPALSQKQTPAVSERRGFEEEMDFDMDHLDLKLDGLDMDFSLMSPDKDGKEDAVDSLSLDDIDASLSIENNKPSSSPTLKSSPAAKASEMDMDADLDFELDLGGLTIPKK
jgi:hypothetical protein